MKNIEKIKISDNTTIEAVSVKNKIKNIAILTENFLGWGGGVDFNT